jgi:hypothetical protein
MKFVNVSFTCNWMTTSSKIVLGKLIVAQLLKNLPLVTDTGRFALGLRLVPVLRHFDSTKKSTPFGEAFNCSPLDDI